MFRKIKISDPYHNTTEDKTGYVEADVFTLFDNAILFPTEMERK